MFSHCILLCPFSCKSVVPEKEIEQQGSAAPAPQTEKKKFSFLNPDEIAKMKEEEERRIGTLLFKIFSIYFE